MKYRKKPVEIDAFRYGVDPAPEWFDTAARKGKIEFFVITNDGVNVENKFVEIKTMAGMMRANKGDYIIRGVAGELYPCKARIFEQTYEEVREDGTTDL